jgi:hypothetical protein
MFDYIEDIEDEKYEIKANKDDLDNTIWNPSSHDVRLALLFFHRLGKPLLLYCMVQATGRTTCHSALAPFARGI